MKKCYYFNTGFDLGLAGAPTDHRSDLVKQMGLLFLVVGKSTDRILLDVACPDDYRNFLLHFGLELPEIVSAQNSCRGYQGIPWGWNQDAHDRLLELQCQIQHPLLSTIAQCNSREFSTILGQQHSIGIPDSIICKNMTDITSALSLSTHWPKVIKPFFGNAGMGFIFKEHPDLTSTETNKLERIFKYLGQGVIVEPWLARENDYSVKVTIEPDGQHGPITFHQTLSGKNGIFYGIRLSPHAKLEAPWAPQLIAATEIIIKHLHQQGYYGPIGIDSFTYRNSENKQQLVPLVEINARYAMSIVAYQLQEKLAPDKHCLIRYFRKKKLRLPTSYKQWIQLIGKSTFNPTSQTGILPFTPLMLVDGRKPQRYGFFIAAHTTEEITQYENYLLEICTKHG